MPYRLHSPHPQLKHEHKVIAPEVYDEALRLTPGLCPLTIVGDLRSGARLLADAAADSVQTVTSAASSPAGRAGLMLLMARVEARAIELERRLADLDAH